MLTAKTVAKWFLFQNPELALGHIDENTKLNKLLYFSNLMYKCVENEILIEDEFVAFPNGPVVQSIYKDYRYNGLDKLPLEEPKIECKQLKILEIVDFVYGNSPVNDLIRESHEQSLFKNVEHLIPHNPRINFDNIDDELVTFYKSLFATYSNFDFKILGKIKINDNIFYYKKENFLMTDEVVDILSKLGKLNEPKFLEYVSGELIIS